MDFKRLNFANIPVAMSQALGFRWKENKCD